MTLTDARNLLVCRNIIARPTQQANIQTRSEFVMSTNGYWHYVDYARAYRNGNARQFCRKCIQSCTPAVTLTFDGGLRRLHWCAEHSSDADQYRSDAD